ncbi:MAG TPA: homogentisate 1,2-dioxygenase [Candidatus Marinimicrobia bacterium]|jgi:homogentisate 1,2-dioxygenase|nr:homogentisate 1,2-dioxygenase [Candidatus Neomarinimicrobiota bacterium]HIB34617.1 homogentisate 1,2-dioxygenase [Candidatus Neomarinimicrobiota bacterium]
MPFYQKRGQIPNKRHIQFRDDRGNLYWEELISRKGFSHIYSNVYHIHPPTAVQKVGDITVLPLEEWHQTHRHHHLKTRGLDHKGDAVTSRIPLFFNSDVILSKAHTSQSMNSLYRNGHHDECLFVHSGKGTLKSNFGTLALTGGDYAIIPRGVIWQLDIEKPMELLVVETAGPIETPDRYRNRLGQLLEHSPFNERDIKTPQYENPVSDGPIEVVVRLVQGLQSYEYRHHPFDIVGWDGCYFPWAFNVNDFMPITGKVHQPPPVHQVFQAPGLVICNFVPRIFDYHPEAVPAPYAHSNVDSDEILYYVSGDFMSRRGIEEGSITYHPAGLPHGPQPDKIEESLGTKEANEIAVMVDTFHPLKMTNAAADIDESDYPLSWLGNS